MPKTHHLILLLIAASCVLAPPGWAEPWDWYTHWKTVPSREYPGYYEFHFYLGGGDAYSCDNMCPANCAPDGCGPSWAPSVDCFDGWCGIEPGQYSNVCAERTWYCEYFSPGCYLQNFTNWNVNCNAFRGAWNGYDPVTGVTHWGFPPQEPNIALGPCKTDTLTDTWLPVYGDSLCFEVSVNMPLEVTIRLNTSTYEGIAMNAPVPATDADSLNDIVPCDVEGALTLGFAGYSEVGGVFLWHGWLSPTFPREIWLRNQDYATAATLEAWWIEDPEVYAKAEIPVNYERFLSNADPDSDGFTNWEEYRGFSDFGGHIFSSRPTGALDSLGADLFFGDPWDVIPSSTFSTLGDVTLANVIDLDDAWLAATMAFPGRYGLHLYLDYKSKLFTYLGWVHSSLCDPPGLENLPLNMDGYPVELADQGIIEIIPSDQNAYPIAGETGQQIWEISGHPYLYRGPAGCNGIVVFFGTQDWWIDFICYPNGLQPAQESAVRLVELSRTIYHETGHALGIDHHDPVDFGGYECVMKYDFTLPNSAEEWDIFIQRGPGHGYGYTGGVVDGFECDKERGLRPRGPSLP